LGYITFVVVSRLRKRTLLPPIAEDPSRMWPARRPARTKVFIVGQAAGLVTYACNIYFIWLGERAPSSANVA
jgi:hypothetical protein